MRIWICMLAALILAGCSHTSAPAPAVTQVLRPTVAPDRTSIEIARGTQVQVRVDEPINTRRNRAGDLFRATLAEPVLVGGKVLIPSGTRFVGRVVYASPAGLERPAMLSIILESFHLAGKAYPVQTERVERAGIAPPARNAGLISGRGLGAVIGVISGGSKTEAVPDAATAQPVERQDVGLPAESTLTFSLDATVTL